MAGIPHKFTFKCTKGHITERVYPPGTRIEDNDETTCEKCLGVSEVTIAYVIGVESVKGK